MTVALTYEVEAQHDLQRHLPLPRPGVCRTRWPSLTDLFVFPSKFHRIATFFSGRCLISQFAGKWGRGKAGDTRQIHVGIPALEAISQIAAVGLREQIFSRCPQVRLCPRASVFRSVELRSDFLATLGTAPFRPVSCRWPRVRAAQPSSFSRGLWVRH